MTDINNVIAIGNLIRGVDDDEKSFGYTNNGTARANVSIAVNRSVKKEDEWTDEVSYFDVVIWGKTAENLRNYLVKGQKIAVKGYLKQDRWQKDGQNFSRVVIIAEQVQLVGNKKTEDNGGGNPAYSQPNSSMPSTFTPKENVGAEQAFDENGFPEDMPF